MADAALRKRQQISGANRMMFMWVAIASALISFAAVVSFFMIQRLAYNQRVIGAQEKSINTIRANMTSADTLLKEVKVKNTSSMLALLKDNEADEPAQVILDALPSNPNSAAFGASLQEKFLNKPGVRIDAVSVTPIQGVEDDGTAATNARSATGSTNYSKILFSYTVSVHTGRADLLWEIIKDMERSIRAVNVTNLSIDNNSSEISMNVDGEAYYQPAATLQLVERAIQ